MGCVRSAAAVTLHNLGKRTTAKMPKPGFLGHAEGIVLTMHMHRPPSAHISTESSARPNL